MIRNRNYEKAYRDNIKGTNQVLIKDHRILGVPENLNIDTLLIEHPFYTRQKKLKREVLREWIIFFVAYFYRKSIFWQNVKIEANELKKIWDQYAEVTNWLQEVGVLHIQNHSEGNFPRTYRISVNYTGFRLTPLFNLHIIKKVDEYFTTDKPDERTSFLRPFLDDLTLVPPNYGFLNERRQNLVRDSFRKFRGDSSRVWRKEERWSRTITQKLLQTELDFKTRRFDFHPDENTSRLYTTVTMMVSDQRAFLRYKGEPLWEADMSSAMPFLALGILCPRPYMELDIEPLIYRHTQLHKHPEVKKETWRLLERIHTDGVHKYQELVCSGKLYDHLAERSGKPKDHIKREMFWALFDKVDSKAPLKKLLVEEFPDIMRFFDLLKVGFSKSRREGRKWYEPTNGLCLILYRLESNLFIDRVARTYHDKYPEAPLFTVHDAILSTEEHIEALRDLIGQLAEEMIGVRPNVKLSPLAKKPT